MRVLMATLYRLVLGFFILGQLLAALPFHAQARIPQSDFSSELLLPTDRPTAVNSTRSIQRSNFPKDFIFGTGTSAFQVEGAVSEGGKGISIWDTWSHVPGHIFNGDNADVAVDHYNRYKEDIDLLAAMNMDTYRFSISWTRIFPNGKGPEVNEEGVAFYNRVIDYLLSKDIKPFVTLYHWDLPQALQDSYGGWLSPEIVDDFAAFAEVCFAAFGDRVKLWTTLNEPTQFLHGWGGSDRTAPGRNWAPSTEPYIAAHNVLRAHAVAVDVYRQRFQAEQEGMIGITLEIQWGEPLTNSTEDIEAAERRNVFQLGWFLDPLYFGDYPAVMRTNIGSRLPRFSPEESTKLKGSLDFIGINQYTARWVTNGPGPSPNKESSVDLDQHVSMTDVKNGVDIGPTAVSQWLISVPWGLYKALTWTSERYHCPPIFITENGFDTSAGLTLEESLRDAVRINFLESYLQELLRAVREGVDVRGYFAWSLLDNFEWSNGYSVRFGLIHVDYSDGLKRTPKDSARWFAQILDRTGKAS